MNKKKKKKKKYRKPDDQIICPVYHDVMGRFILTLQSSKSRIVCLLIFKVKQDSQGDDILLTLQGVSFTEVLEGSKF